MLYHSEQERSHGSQRGTRSYLDPRGIDRVSAEAVWNLSVTLILLRMQTWHTLQSSSVKTVSMPWTKVKIESRRIMSDDIWDVGLITNKWPWYQKTNRFKNDYVNLTFLNITSISSRNLFLRSLRGSNNQSISFESYKSSKSAFDEERYDFKEWKSENWRKAFSVKVLSQTSSSGLSTISTRH